jgi:hypothetical protein
MKLENECHDRNAHSDNAIDLIMVQEVWRVIMTAMKKTTAQTLEDKMGGIKLLKDSNKWEQWVVIFSVILNMFNQALCHPALPLPFPSSTFLPFFL